MKVKPIHIYISNQQLADAIDSDKFKDHREFITKLFFMRKWRVKEGKFQELKFFYYPKYMVVEGIPNVSIESF